MIIVLLRHGRPDIPELGKLRAREIHKWVKSYNSAGLKGGNNPSTEAIEIANSCSAIVCSDLLRSLESAKALGVEEIDYVEPLFREVELPYGNFPSPKLSANTWTTLLRALWFFGYSSNGESLNEAKARASNGAGRLKSISTNTDSVLLVGHGFVNRFIANELLSSGWQGPACPGKRYWEFGVYEYATGPGNSSGRKNRAAELQR